MSLAGANRPKGDITTLLDLTNRDAEENALYPINTDTTWFTRDTKRRIMPATPIFQEIPFRGPANYGQRFTFDVGSMQAGDMIHAAAIQIRLTHWLDPTSVIGLAGGSLTYSEPQSTWWQFINNLGTNILQSAELEVDGVGIETLDGEFIHIYNLLFPDINSQSGAATDLTGLRKIRDVVSTTEQRPYPFPTEDGIITVVLPFFFMRVKYRESLPLIAIKEGNVRINVTLRPFDQVVRQVCGYRSGSQTPLGQTFGLTPTPRKTTIPPLQVVPGYGNITITSPTSFQSSNNTALNVNTFGGRVSSIYSIDGPCQVTYIAKNLYPAPYTSYIIGLATTIDQPNPDLSGSTNNGYTGINYYNIYLIQTLASGISQIRMFIDGVSTTLSGLINMGDIIQIRYTGIRFEVLINGIVKRSIIKQASGSLYLVAQTNSYALVPLTVITDVSFTPLTGGQIRYPSTTTATAVANPPDFDRVGLLTWGTLVTGTFRERMMREPYEFLYRELQSFLFDEPITYQIVKTTNSDVVSVQLPIEANHPIEEVIWVIRRRAVADNNEWYNFGSYLERDFAYAAASGIPLEQRPLLTYARLQANGQPLIEGDERYFRRQIGQHHDGGYTAYNQYVYGYSFAKTPGDHQPSGTANASRLSSFRLTLDVAVPTVFKSPSANASTDLTWEVRVYVLALNWLRVENGLVNRIYQD